MSDDASDQEDFVQMQENHLQEESQDLEIAIEEQPSNNGIEIQQPQLKEGTDDSEMDIEHPQQKNQQNHDYDSNQYGGDYDQYGGYDDYGNEYSMNEDQSMPGMQKRISSQDNKQYQMEDLLKIIEKELKEVVELTGFQRSWALLYFESCGWKQELVVKFIDTKNTHHQLIHFIPGASAQLKAQQTMCHICCLEDQPMIKNICGHTYCSECWKLHLKQKLMSFNKEPFPPCINQECKNRVAPIILEHFSSSDQQFRKLYTRTLCRSYAYGNPSVKLCKGRKGFSCDTCFKIKKMFQVLECEQCGNFVCAKCGDEYHQPSECFDKKNWQKLADSAFVNFEMNNATACPTCKQLIHKYVGCNYIRCVCKQEFCYVCGEKWLPNHNDHFNCYRAKEMGVMLIEKQKKLEDEKKYLQKLEQEKKEVVKYEDRLRIVEKLDVKEVIVKLVTKFKILSNNLDYLYPLQKSLRISLLIEKSIRIAKYFNNEQAIKLCVLNIQEIIMQVQDFLLVKIPVIFQSAEMLEKQTVKVDDMIYYKGEKIDPKEEFRKDKEKMMKNLRFLEKWIKEL